jgi:hypothetical protein
MGLTFSSTVEILSIIAMSKYDSCIFLSSDNTVEWEDVFSRMKPGAHTVAICPVLEHHRITQRVEDSGFEIRDSILFLGEPSLIAMLARVPLDGTVAENVLRYSTGCLNIDKCRVEFSSEKEREKHSQEWDRDWKSRIIHYWDDQIGNHPGPKMEKGSGPRLVQGRWPSNVILSKCPPIIGQFPTSGSGNGSSPYLYSGREYNNKETSMFNGDKPQSPSNYNDNGSAARFFYSVQGDDKVGGLIDYLVKMVNPPGGEVLFLGSTRYNEHL